jgi:hypothetical protein
MAKQTILGADPLGKSILDGDIKVVAFATGSTDAVTLNPSDTDVLISNTSSSDCYIVLPPVAECRGLTFTFLKTDSGTQSVFLIPNSWITSTLNGGDSINWEGSTGYDFDTQYDSLVLRSNGVSWINPATAAIA